MGNGIFHIHEEKSTASTETDLEGVVCKVAPATQAPAADMVQGLHVEPGQEKCHHGKDYGRGGQTA